MADRNSAAIFGNFFVKLASDPTEQHKQWAAEVWEESLNYDFTPDQMLCDGALFTLGLARRGVDPHHPGRGVDPYHPENDEVIIYGPEKATSQPS